MYKPCSFSYFTKDYLSAFYEILDDMIAGMKGACLTDSISQNFISQMIPHHRAAIRMSENVLQYNPEPALAEIAADIIAEQTQSIRDMQNVLAVCQTQKNSCQDINLYRREFRIILDTMYTGMDTACATDNISDNFMREMIPHHEGAVAMSQNALRYCICGELVPILNAIISSQEKGIREMQQLLAAGQGK